MSNPFRIPPERVSSPRPNLRPSDIPVSRTSSASTSKTNTQRRSSRSLQDPPTLPPLTGTAPLPLPFSAEIPEETTAKKCDACEQCVNRAWNCVYCDMYFCDPCWDKQGPHKLGRTGPDGLPHEKADPNIVKRLKDILTPPTDPGEQQSLHLDDEDTKWYRNECDPPNAREHTDISAPRFGVARDQNDQPIFRDYGRYATIMADSTTGAHKLRYPQLVSFIGQTGAGKSTLIKMLIDQQVRRGRHMERLTFPSPVVGSTRNENVPTSGDVHLYADPKTYFGQYPMLYADSEGLEGGANLVCLLLWRTSLFCQNFHVPHRSWMDSLGT